MQYQDLTVHFQQPLVEVKGVFKIHLNICDVVFWENNERLLAANYFCIKASSLMLDWILTTPLEVVITSHISLRL